MRDAVAITLGLAGAAIAQLLAFFMAGAGHGWITPFWFSMPLWVLMPVGFVLSDARAGYPRRRRAPLLVMAAVGICLDIGLVWATIEEGVRYFWRVLESAPPFPIAWIALFAGWQVAVGATLLAGSRAETE